MGLWVVARVFWEITMVLCVIPNNVVMILEFLILINKAGILGCCHFKSLCTDPYADTQLFTFQN